MAVIMLVAGNERFLNRLTLTAPMHIGGWLATLIMQVASVGFFSASIF